MESLVQKKNKQTNSKQMKIKLPSSLLSHIRNCFPIKFFLKGNYVFTQKINTA